MRARRIACLLLGAWLAGTILIGWVATSNFSAVDVVLTSPPAQIQKAIAGIDAGHARMYLRYLVAIENGGYFLTWELVEFALLLALVAALLGERHTRLLVVVPVIAMLFAGFQHFRLTPEIIWVGQSMVLAGGSATAHQRDQFANLHRIYGGIEVLKLLLAAALAIWLVITDRRRKVRRSVAAEAPETFDRRYAN